MGRITTLFEDLESFYCLINQDPTTFGTSLDKHEPMYCLRCIKSERQTSFVGSKVRPARDPEHKSELGDCCDSILEIILKWHVLGSLLKI